MPAPILRPAPSAPLWAGRSRSLLWEGEPALVCTVEPLDLPGAPARVARYYRRLEEAWLARWEKVLYPRACAALRAARQRSRPWRPWEARLAAAVTLRTEALLSLTVEAAERLDGPRPVLLRRGGVWTLPDGRPAEPAELFPPRPRWRRRVLEEALRQLRARESAGEARFWPDWERRLARALRPEGLWLTEEGWAAAFPMYALGPGAEGCPTVRSALPGPLPQPRI